MSEKVDLSNEELARSLAYVGFVLVAFELVKSLIVGPIREFYENATFGSSVPFESYDKDVRSRHRNDFEACLLYLRDFMEAIDSNDLLAIQGLRKHRNELAHDLANRLYSLDVESYVPLLEKVDEALFKLSNYGTYMELGSDPEFLGQCTNWDTVYGKEHMIFREIVSKLRILQLRGFDAQQIDSPAAGRVCHAACSCNPRARY